MRLRCRSAGGIERLRWCPPYPRAQRRWMTLPSPKNVGPPPRPVKTGQRVAVIGGGITGLVSAYNLAKDPSTHVTIYEKSSKLGGWLQSETLGVGDGQVVFDYGARTLRYGYYDGLAIATVIYELGLMDDVVFQKAPGSYVYWPDRLVAVAPSTFSPNFWVRFIEALNHWVSEPLFRAIFPAVFHFVSRQLRDSKVSDESVTEFLVRTTGSERLADNIASAIAHGTYAGDIDKLSARALLGRYWKYEKTKDGVFDFWVDRKKPYIYSRPYTDIQLVIAAYGDSHHKEQYLSICKTFFRKIYTFKGGMGNLIDALHSTLSLASNVEIVTEANISKIRKLANGGKMVVQLDDRSRSNFDYVVSTTPSEVLANQISDGNNGRSTTATTRLLRRNNYAVSVMVVNLFYQTPSLTPPGFGYLIPRSTPKEQNPEHGLGVVFMSDATAGQDTTSGTKVTVMIGGHWWDNWKDEDLPTEEQAIDMAKCMLGRHLGISEEPVLAKAKLQKNCIPQLTRGHIDRMQELHDALINEYDGRLKVSGAWYVGPGVSTCGDYALMTAKSVLTGETGATGLEVYLNSHNDVPHEASVKFRKHELKARQ